MEDTLTEFRGYRWIAELADAAGISDQGALHSVMRNAHELQVTGVDQLLDSGLLKEDDFSRLASEKIGMELFDEAIISAKNEEIAEAFPAQLAVRAKVVPLEITDEKVEICCYDPFDMTARQLVSRAISTPVTWKISSRRRVREAISGIYGVGAGTFESILNERNIDHLISKDEAMVIDDDLSEEASVLKFVNNIIRESISQKATDIHFEPHQGKLRIRYRVDGHLLDVPIPEHIHKLESFVVARLKIMAKLDVAERRIPQDGRIHMSHEGRSMDVRVATIPTVEGETVSLRLLNQGKFSLDSLELEKHVRDEIDQVLKLSDGVILATGPTGSGKSTSLYCFLDKLNRPETRIVTIEDPVENKLPGLVQIAVKPEVGLDFAKGLRSILRADPNVVMVGEIRDTETAEIAIRASLTGHLVFSTLHTNSAVGAVSRLIDMGVEPFLVSASVRGVLAQRLVRRLCKHCAKPIEDWDEHKREQIGIPPELEGIPHEAVGCSECRFTGYSGRVALYEIFRISEAIEEIIGRNGDEFELREKAAQEGFEGMRMYGFRKVMQGVTSMEEVLSSTQSHLLR
ncbi:GspE/PulE family protein [Luteolibacter sp. AS25]|uniref:GspE/PulE family protein n=1 Tax=Luteolibacter sp. AS25 TaxID=3135776 RepID=UPI00398B5A78